MIKSGKGGGNTRTGLVFEGKTDLSSFLAQQPHYKVLNHQVYFNGVKVAEVYKKYDFYNIFLKKPWHRLDKAYIKKTSARRQHFCAIQQHTVHHRVQTPGSCGLC